MSKHVKITVYKTTIWLLVFVGNNLVCHVDKVVPHECLSSGALPLHITVMQRRVVGLARTCKRKFRNLRVLASPQLATIYSHAEISSLDTPDGTRNSLLSRITPS